MGEMNTTSFTFPQKLTSDALPPLRVVVISDTHNAHSEFDEIPEGDVLIHCGDFSNKGTREEVEAFNDWIGSLPHDYKLVVAGNHDVGPFKFLSDKNSNVALSNCTFLDNSSVNIRGVVFYGSGWNRKRANSRKIPSNANVLITHSPPGDILSGTGAGTSRHFGCDYLKEEVVRAAQNGALKLHLFGHVHESAGLSRVESMVFVNASSVSSGIGQTAHIRNKPIIIDIP